MIDSLWKSINFAPRNGKDVWLGWAPLRDENGIITSEVVPRIGRWDIGSQAWVSHFEDHGEAEGHRPMSFEPQPDYYCEGFIPPAPVY